MGSRRWDPLVKASGLTAAGRFQATNGKCRGRFRNGLSIGTSEVEGLPDRSDQA